MTDKKPKLIVIGGINGAGKSTLREIHIQKDNEYVVIDPDKLSKQYKDELGTDNSNMKGGREAIKIFNDAIENKKSIMLETTLSGNSVFKRYDKAKENNYHITTVYVGLEDLKTHKERVSKRVKLGGHHISDELIEKRFANREQQLLKAFGKSDTFQVIDNSKNIGVKIHFNKATDKSIVYSNDKPWVNTIAKKISQEYQIPLRERKLEQVKANRVYVGEVIKVEDKNIHIVSASGRVTEHAHNKSVNKSNIGQHFKISYDNDMKADITNLDKKLTKQKTLLKEQEKGNDLQK